MSLLRRFLSWARGETDEEEEERSLFECLPIELYGEIFKYLDVENLKTCKSVCKYWYKGLLASRIMLKKSMSTWNVLDNETSLTQNDRSYFCNRVRIHQHFGVMANIRMIGNGDIILTHFTKLDGFKYITFMEISNMTMTSDILAPLISKMELLNSLTAIDIFYDVFQSNRNLKNPNPEWTNLRNLTIQVNHVGAWSFAQIFTIGNYCTNLEYLNFQGFCSPRLDDVYSFAFGNIFDCFLSTLRKNSKTLKSAVLDTFKIEYNRDFIVNDQEQVHEDQDGLFNIFLNSLNFMNRADTDSDPPIILLKQLHLGFQLVRKRNAGAQEFFMPFLRTLRDLKEFSLSHVHFPGDGRSTVQELRNCLPANCRTRFEGIMTIRMRDPQAAPPLNAFDDDDDEDSYLPSPIHGYFDSTVGLFTASHSLKLRFVSCNSFDIIDFFTRNIQFLTKIKVDQSGTLLRHKIALDDGDMQRIIRTAIHLTDLCLEFCDLSAITDFGLTGITPDACARMALTRSFDLQDGDRVGSPVSQLRNLRSLKLSTVGNQVTDVTAYHAFMGLNSLACFGMSTPQMTSNGFREIRRIFEFNQVVQFDPFTKCQFRHIESAGIE